MAAPYTHTHTHTRRRTCTRLHVHTRTHTHTYTQTHAHARTHTRAHFWLDSITEEADVHFLETEKAKAFNRDVRTHASADGVGRGGGKRQTNTDICTFVSSCTA